MKKAATLISVLISVYTASVSGQDISVSAAFDTTSIYIGDQLNFSVTIDQPSVIKLALPVFRDSLSKNIEILSGPSIDSAKIAPGRIRITEKYLVTSFDSGHYAVDPVFIELKDDRGVKRFYSGYSYLKVLRTQAAPADTSMKIFDIVKPYRAPLTLGEIMPWILAAMVAVAAIWFLVRFLKKIRKEKKSITEPVIKEPAHVIAYRELERLKAENLWQRGETKKYYTRLTEILRQYLENRFGVFSLELTTSETLEALVKTGFKKDESYNKLKLVLTEADLVKFAKYKPEPAENESSYSNSWDFITATRPEETAAVNSGENGKKSEESV